MVNISVLEDGKVRILVSDVDSIGEVAGAVETWKSRHNLTEEDKQKKIAIMTARRDKLSAAIEEWNALPTEKRIDGGHGVCIASSGHLEKEDARDDFHGE